MDQEIDIKTIEQEHHEGEDILEELGDEDFKKILSTTPTFSSVQFKERCPEIVKHMLNALDTSDREEDLFMVSLLCNLGAYFASNTKMIHHDSVIYPTFYAFVTTKSGSGKRRIGHGYDVVKFEDDARGADYNRKVQRRAEMEKNEPERASELPPIYHQSFRMPDTSEAKMLQFLKSADEEENGMVINFQEADTFINMSSKQHGGGISSLIRYATDHEEVSTATKTDHSFVKIKNPKLSIILAGTYDQPSKMFMTKDNDSNGLMYRFVFYAFYHNRPFKAGFGSREKNQTDAKMNGLSSYFAGYQKDIIEHGMHPVEFAGTKEQAIFFENFFNQLSMDNAGTIDDIDSFIVRMANTALSIIMVLERLNKVHTDSFVYISDEMFYLGLDLMSVLAKHTFTTANLLLNRESKVNIKGVKKVSNASLLDDFKKHWVGKGNFGYTDLHEYCSTHEYGKKKSESSIRKMISVFAKKGAIKNAEKYGEYKFQ